MVLQNLQDSIHHHFTTIEKLFKEKERGRNFSGGLILPIELFRLSHITNQYTYNQKDDTKYRIYKTTEPLIKRTTINIEDNWLCESNYILLLLIISFLSAYIIGPYKGHLSLRINPYPYSSCFPQSSTKKKIC